VCEKKSEKRGKKEHLSSKKKKNRSPPSGREKARPVRHGGGRKKEKNDNYLSHTEKRKGFQVENKRPETRKGKGGEKKTHVGTGEGGPGSNSDPYWSRQRRKRRVPYNILSKRERAYPTPAPTEKKELNPAQ